MNDQTDPAAFRRQATIVYKATMIGLVVFVLGCAWFGWRFWGVWGVVVATVIGLFVAAGAAVAFTLLYAMSQDGA